MRTSSIKQLVATVICICLSCSICPADELYDDGSYNSEINGLLYVKLPFDYFDSKNNQLSPTFGFSVARNNYTANMVDLNPMLENPGKNAMVDIQFNLQQWKWSRFAFGGINALVDDGIVYVDGEGGGGVTIDPTLILIGAGFAGFILFIGDDDDPLPPPPPPPQNGG